MRVCLQGKSHGAGQTKVRNFNLRGLRVHQKVARLEVSVHDAALVTVQGALEQLVEDALYLWGVHRPAQLVQVLLHILVEVLEDQKESVPLQPVLNVHQTHNVRVVAELLQNGNLAYSCARDSIVTMVNLDFFDGYDSVRAQFTCFINDSVSTFSKSFLILERLK